MAFPLLSFWMQTSFLRILSFGGFKLLRDKIPEGGLAEWGFHFVDWNFVFQLAVFCTSNVQLITDVYSHRFRWPFKEQRYLLNVASVCSETFAVFELVFKLLNICTLNVTTVQRVICLVEVTALEQSFEGKLQEKDFTRESLFSVIQE